MDVSPARERTTRQESPKRARSPLARGPSARTLASLAGTPARLHLPRTGRGEGRARRGRSRRSASADRGPPSGVRPRASAPSRSRSRSRSVHQQKAVRERRCSDRVDGSRHRIVRCGYRHGGGWAPRRASHCACALPPAARRDLPQHARRRWMPRERALFQQRHWCLGPAADLRHLRRKGELSPPLACFSQTSSLARPGFSPLHSAYG